jgi:hypothetical protein
MMLFRGGLCFAAPQHNRDIAPRILGFKSFFVQCTKFTMAGIRPPGAGFAAAAAWECRPVTHSHFTFSTLFGLDIPPL